MFATVIKAKVLVLMDTTETREFILGQTSYTFKYSSYNASMQPPVSLIFIHSPVILPYISNTVSWINIILDIVDQSDTLNDLIIYIGHFDLHSMVE